MPSNCSKAWVCANISRRSARMASVPWWSGFAPMPVLRSLRPPSGAARLQAITGLDYLQGRIASPDAGGFVKVRYFAWVRERVGKAEEDIDPPDGIATVGGSPTGV